MMANLKTLYGSFRQDNLDHDIVLSPDNSLRMSDADENWERDLVLRMRAVRDVLGKTQDMVAEDLGVSRSAIGHYDQLNRSYPVRILRAFCRRYGVSSDWLLFGDPSGLHASRADAFIHAFGERKAASATKRVRRPKSSEVLQ